MVKKKRQQGGTTRTQPKPLTATHFPGTTRLFAARRYYEDATSDEATSDPPPSDEEAWSEVDSAESYGPGVEDLYGEDLGVCTGGKVIRPANAKTELPEEEDYIAEICTSRLNLKELRRLDSEGELTGVLDLITKPAAFADALLPEARQELRKTGRKVSRHMLHHLDTLVEYGVLTEADAHPYLTLPAFTVSKKSGGQRFIVDARRLNALMTRPPDMRLQDITEVTQRVAAASWVVMADARSWFYQFPVHKEIQRYFEVRLGGERKTFVKTFLTVMCMGWSHSPAIANRSARVLLPPEHGIVWIDNFIAVGDSLPEAQARYADFISRCEKVGAALNFDDTQHGVPLQDFTVFGIHFDLTRHRFRMDTAWVQKVLGREEYKEVVNGHTTPRRAFRVFGSFVWQSYVMRTPMCYMPAVLSFVRRIAKQTHSNNARWDSRVAVPPSVQAETVARTRLIEDNEWYTPQNPPPTIELWTDASSTAWAAVLVLPGGESVSQGAFEGSDADTNIFLKEAYAVWQGVRMMQRVREASVTCHIDNLGLVFALRKGHCANYRGNLLLQEIYTTARRQQIRLIPHWVATHDQRADAYTRGTQATHPVELPPVSMPPTLLPARPPR